MVSETWLSLFISLLTSYLHIYWWILWGMCSRCHTHLATWRVLCLSHMPVKRSKHKYWFKYYFAMRTYYERKMLSCNSEYNSFMSKEHIVIGLTKWWWWCIKKRWANWAWFWGSSEKCLTTSYFGYLKAVWVLIHFIIQNYPESSQVKWNFITPYNIHTY